MTFDPTGLDGEWQPFKAELDGQAAPELALTKTTLKVQGERYHISFAGETADRGKIACSESGPFPSLHLTSTHGETDGRVLPGIFQLRGDLLRLCLGLNGVLPSDFTAPAKSEKYFILYRRKK